MGKNVKYILFLLSASLCLHLNVDAFEHPFFNISSDGEVNCDTANASCVWSERLTIQEDGGTYIIEGNTSKQEYLPPNPLFHDAGFVNYPFVYLCQRKGSQLIPFYNFLKGSERNVQIDLIDLDQKSPKEIFVTRVYPDRKSDVTVYKLGKEGVITLFYIESDDSNARVEDVGGRVMISVLSSMSDELKTRAVYQTLVWNGITFTSILGTKNIKR